MQFRHWLHRIYSGPRQHRLFKQSHRRYGRRQQVFQGRKRSRRLCKKSGQFQKNKHKKSIGLYNKKTWKKPPSISLYRRIRLPPCLRILQIFPVHNFPPYQLFHAKTRKIRNGRITCLFSLVVKGENLMSLSPTSTQYLVGTPWWFFAGSENPSVRVAHCTFEITLSGTITLTLLLVCAFSPRVHSIPRGPH